MDIRHLRSFVQVVESGSFTRAAEKLQISQPAVGLQLRTLENTLGVTLLVRHSRGIVPTREGETLLRSARTILAEFDRIPKTIQDASTVAVGIVRLGLAPSISLLLAGELLPLAARHLPGIDLQIIESTSTMLKQSVADGQIDLAIGCEGEPMTDVRELSILRESLFLVTPWTGEACGRDIPFASLAGRRIMLADPMRTGLVQAKLKTASIGCGVEVRIAGVYPSYDTVKLLVEDGKGDTILPWSSVQRECRQGRMTALRIVAPEITRNALLFSHLSRHYSLAQSEVLRLINRTIRQQRDLAPPHALSAYRAIPA